MREFSLIYFKGCFEPKAPPFEVNRPKRIKLNRVLR